MSFFAARARACAHRTAMCAPLFQLNKTEAQSKCTVTLWLEFLREGQAKKGLDDPIGRDNLRDWLQYSTQPHSPASLTLLDRGGALGYPPWLHVDQWVRMRRSPASMGIVVGLGDRLTSLKEDEGHDQSTTGSMRMWKGSGVGLFCED